MELHSSLSIINYLNLSNSAAPSVDCWLSFILPMPCNNRVLLFYNLSWILIRSWYNTINLHLEISLGAITLLSCLFHIFLIMFEKHYYICIYWTVSNGSLVAENFLAVCVSHSVQLLQFLVSGVVEQKFFLMFESKSI